MFNMWKIAFNAFRESLREPVYFLMLLAALLLIAHYPPAAIFVFSEQLKLVVDSSMATTLLFGLIVSVLCSSYTVAREMRNGTVLLLMSKPIQRWSFVLGKILGIAMAGTLFVAVCNFATFISVFIATDQFRFEMPLYFTMLGLLALGCVAGMLANYLKACSFPEIATWATAVLIPLFAVYCYLTGEHPSLSLKDLTKALILVNFAVVTMSTFAVVFATRFDIVPNLCLCTALFFAGLVSSYLFQRTTDNEILNGLCAVLYAVFPNWQFFWLADAVAVKRHIPDDYILNAALYLVIYIILGSTWAVATFQHKELAGDSRN